MRDVLLGHLERAARITDKARRQVYLAAIVAEALRRCGLHGVLVGGAAVELYTFGEYTTVDVDVVCGARGTELARALEPLGFQRETDLRHWSHPDLPIPVEFPPTPARVGSLSLRAARLEVEGLAVDVVSLEDAILDRALAAQEWRDPGSADQAVLMMIAHYGEIDWSLLHARAAKASVLETIERLQRKAKRRLRAAPR